MKTTSKETSYKRAKERVDALKGFFISASVYMIIIPLLWYINYQTTGFPWAIFPTLGWGFGLIMKYMASKGIDPLWGRQWEERKINELMRDSNF
ncbi:2TM domain-containing protein [Eudoraea chungangensis]|uniref:2TM domain-containing protein n=1 Tax=Eudoraea chungangensis TaxID=1481905 RepID=UPI0023EE194D|nr:2TM domain-containing protein [Eudoraea chungangensis]